MSDSMMAGTRPSQRSRKKVSPRLERSRCSSTTVPLIVAVAGWADGVPREPQEGDHKDPWSLEAWLRHAVSLSLNGQRLAQEQIPRRFVTRRTGPKGSLRLRIVAR